MLIFFIVEARAVGPEGELTAERSRRYRALWQQSSTPSIVVRSLRCCLLKYEATMLSAAVSASPSIQAGMASTSSASEKPATNAAVTSSPQASPSSSAGGANPNGTGAGAGGGPAALRFEDLTIDDALPPLPRLRRYVRSGIALQRLVHVKMLGEVAAGVG